MADPMPFTTTEGDEMQSTTDRDGLYAPWEVPVEEDEPVVDLTQPYERVAAQIQAQHPEINAQDIARIFSV